MAQGLLLSHRPVVLASVAAYDVTRIVCTTVTTPFGRAWLASTDGGICGLAYPDEEAPPQHRSSEMSLRQQIAVAFPRAVFYDDQSAGLAWWAQLFDTHQQQPVPLVVNATAFTLRVWNALLAIPHGAVMTYGGLAEELQAPRATRAVGTAVGRNPISWLIPCHRVVPAAGDVGQYRWGSERKRLMLAWEACAASAAVASDFPTFASSAINADQRL